MNENNPLYPSNENEKREDTNFEPPIVNSDDSLDTPVQENHNMTEHTYEYQAEPIYEANTAAQYSASYPQQQTQWTFNEYGPMGQPPKQPKKRKTSNGKNTGIKVFAIVMSALFVVSITTLVGFIAFGQKDIIGNTVSEGGMTQKPTVELKDTPENSTYETDPNTGKMTAESIYQSVNPSVVGIVSYVKTTGYQEAGQGSGVIISKDGYIVTNAHVITSGNARMPIAKIEVVLNNEETYTARLLGKDTKSDLAVLKIEANNLTPATFGNSESLSVGAKVYVIGNPNGLTFAGSMTQGIVSATNRDVYMSDTGETMEFIQTDAAINPGNSGGALVNEYGQVIGISSAKIASVDYEGIGFAIPSNVAKPIIDSIIENGYVKGRVRIGISYTTYSETLAQLNGIPHGLRVVEFEEDFDVAKKGIEKGDIITHMDGKEVYDQETISEALKGKSPGDTIKMTIYRVEPNGRANTFDIEVILGEEMPVEVAAEQ